MFSTDYFEPWKKYQHPVVRQLAFAIASANIISKFPSEIQPKKIIEFHSNQQWQEYYKFYEHRLLALDQDPRALIEFLNLIKSTRIGLRFEALLWYWLSDPHNQFYLLLGHSIQTHQNGKTLGEIDFLVKNLITHQIEHWEVCLKYYLAESDLGIEHWIGLNRDDTFLQKLSHLSSKQFQFEYALNAPIERRMAIIKGQLFLPQRHHKIPDWLNPARRQGQWIQQPFKHAHTTIRLKRSEWLCPEFNPSVHAPKFWTNGLYYQPQTEQFLMLRLANPSFVYVI